MAEQITKIAESQVFPGDLRSVELFNCFLELSTVIHGMNFAIINDFQTNIPRTSNSSLELDARNGSKFIL